MPSDNKPIAKKAITITLLLIILLLAMSCMECPTEPDNTELPISSHNFTWEIDTLGRPISYNQLFDIEIIAEDNIYIVGRVRTDSGDYNLGHWDGEKWSFEAVCNMNELRDIIYFSENDIWLVSGAPHHWDGEKWETYHLWNMGVLEDSEGPVYYLWGESSSDIFFVGSRGTIVHYNGSEFSRMESGTEVPLNSIYGTSGNNVWVSGYDNFLNTVLLHYDGKSWRTVYEGDKSSYDVKNRIASTIYGVYTDEPNYVWVIASQGIFRCPYNTKGEGYMIPGINIWEYAIKTVSGNDHNDMFMADAKSAIWHYNGQDFYRYNDINCNCYIIGSDVNGDLAGFVGWIYDTWQVCVIRGRRDDY
jgi:hypothetical protein